jgi:hypothetical protein
MEASMRAILIVIGTSAAILGFADCASAQNSGGSSGSARSGYGAEAPVGHRQPSQSTVQGADEGSQIGMTPQLQRQEKELDRKLKGICRGC